jgi:hypothetical protein
MRKKSCFLIAILVVSLIGLISQAIMVEANFSSGTYSYIDPHSPISEPYIYQNRTIDLSLDYGLPINWTQFNSFSYSLDGNINSTLTYSKELVRDYNFYTVLKPLENLDDGNHTLQVYAFYTNGTAKVLLDYTFMVDTAFQPPTLTILSPLNQTTYGTNEAQITYNVDSKANWAYYKLDPQLTSVWMPLSGNITLTGLSEGSHKIVVTMQSQADYRILQPITQQTIYFTIDTAKNDSALPLDNQVSGIIVASIAIVIIVILAVALYKRKEAKVKSGNT